MKRTMKRFFALALCFVFAFTPVGEVIGTATAVEVKAEENGLNKTELTLSPATMEELKVNDYAGNVSWTTSDVNVAQVTVKGKVIARKLGTAVITAKNGETVLGTCTVTVAVGENSYKGVTYQDVSNKTFGTTGRWYSNAKSTFTNANGSVFYFRTSGTKKVKINFVNKAKKKTAVYSYSIDGSALKRRAVNQDVITLKNENTHYVKVVIDAIATIENRYANAGIGVKSVTPTNTTYGVVAGIVPTNNMIAFYGDSITEGVATLGASYYTDGLSATHSYAWYTATKLGATPYICGYASTGINTPGKNEQFPDGVYNVSFANASTAMARYSKTKAVKKYDDNVKVVVFEYGTNDTVGGDLFVNNYKALIKQAHAAYPDALIVCMIPFFQQKFAGEIRKAASGFDYCKVFETKSIKIDAFDGLHPKDRSSKKIGDKLAKAIAGWSEDF